MEQEQQQESSDSESESESDGEEEEIKRFRQSSGSHADLLPKRDLVVEQQALKPEDRLLLWYLSFSFFCAEGCHKFPATRLN